MKFPNKLQGRYAHIACSLLVILMSGCSMNQSIVQNDADQFAPHQFTEENPQIEHGKDRPIVDGVGWVLGIPRKILYWNSKIDNHQISKFTEQRVANYVHSNEGLRETKVRLNQYDPLDDWKRLTKNQNVGAGYRYTFGVFQTLGDTLFPGRLFGGDRYNPYTNTVHVYSDEPSMGIVETARAKDIRTRVHPGTYAFITSIPGLNLINETNATRDALEFTSFAGTTEDQKDAYRTLYPRYGIKTGGAVSSYITFDTPLDSVFEVTGAVAGHAYAKKKIKQVRSDQPVAQLDH